MRIRAIMAVFAAAAVAGLAAAMVRRHDPPPEPRPDPVRAAHAQVEQAARAYFAAINDSRWHDAGALLDPLMAGDVRQQELNSLLRHAEARHLGRRAPERDLLSDSAAAALLRPYAGDVLRGDGHLVSLGEVVAAGRGGLLARLLAYRAAHDYDLPSFRIRHTLLGVAVEGDTLAHVLYRAVDPSLTYADPWPVSRMEAHRRAGRWVLLPVPDLLSWEPFFDPAEPPARRDAAAGDSSLAAAPRPSRTAPSPSPVSAAWAGAADTVARGFVAALHAGRYAQAARAILPADAREERDLQLGYVAAQLYDRDHPPRFPAAALVYFPRSLSGTLLDSLLRAYAREPLDAFSRVRTVGALAALSPEQLVAHELEMFVRGSGAEKYPRPVSRLAYIGVVVENDSVAHALYRLADRLAPDTLSKELPLDSAPAEPPRLDEPGYVQSLELRPFRGRWYVRFDRGFLVYGGPFNIPGQRGP